MYVVLTILIRARLRNGDRDGCDTAGVNPAIPLSFASLSSTYSCPQLMPKVPKTKSKDSAPLAVGVLSKYFPVDSIPSGDIRLGSPPANPTLEEEARKLFSSYNDEGGFQAFANLYTMVYLAKPNLVQGTPFPPSRFIRTNREDLDA